MDGEIPAVRMAFLNYMSYERGVPWGCRASSLTAGAAQLIMLRNGTTGGEKIKKKRKKCGIFSEQNLTGCKNLRPSLAVLNQGGEGFINLLFCFPPCVSAVIFRVNLKWLTQQL